MSSTIGKILKLSIFGESHGNGIGVVADGLPPGEKIDLVELQGFMDRRSPGNNPLGTKRKEPDIPKILSGLMNDITTGFPLCAIIENTDQRSNDYKNLMEVPRPSHADYTAHIKYRGFADMRGGGHFSGRLTAPICIIGGIAKQILERRGIIVGAHILQVGDIKDDSYDPLSPDIKLIKEVSNKKIAMIDWLKIEKVKDLVSTLAKNGDSIGGIIECVVTNIPSGIGSPIFEGIENRLSQSIFGIPGVKAIEFGSGFAGCLATGSENNDPFIYDGDDIKTTSNHSGGINGGISNGMPIVFKIGMKPTASIAMEQNSVNLSSKENTKLGVRGRHDPCIALRGVPVVEAVTAITILDMMMEEGKI